MRMMLRLFIAVVFIQGLGSSRLWSADSPAKPAGDMLDGQKVELSNNAKVLVGANNVKVTIGPYKKGNAEGALVWLQGIEGDLNGKVLDHRVVPGASDGKNYVTQYQGKDWITLAMRKSYGTESWEMTVPGHNDTIKLTVDDGAAQMTDPGVVLREYTRLHKMK